MKRIEFIRQQLKILHETLSDSELDYIKSSLDNVYTDEAIVITIVHVNGEIWFQITSDERSIMDYELSESSFINSVIDHLNQDIGIIADDEIESTYYSINDGYCSVFDCTVIFKDTYDILTNELVSSELVGWYHGKPNEEDTQRFINKLKAEY